VGGTQQGFRSRCRVESGSYPLLCVVPLEAVVDQALVEDGNEGIVLDMRREVKVPMGSLNAPLLLELGGGFSKVCSGRQTTWLAGHAGLGTRGAWDGGEAGRGPLGGEQRCIHTAFEQVSVSQVQRAWLAADRPRSTGSEMSHGTVIEWTETADGRRETGKRETGDGGAGWWEVSRQSEGIYQ
jgi:hypothetical protein